MGKPSNLGSHAEIAHGILFMSTARLMQDVVRVHLDRGKRQAHIVGDMLVILPSKTSRSTSTSRAERP